MTEYVLKKDYESYKEQVNSKKVRKNFLNKWQTG